MVIGKYKSAAAVLEIPLVVKGFISCFIEDKHDCLSLEVHVQYVLKDHVLQVVTLEEVLKV